MVWDIEFTNEYEEWWDSLNASEQLSVESVVTFLEKVGPALSRPYSDTVKGSRHSNMKELRIQHQGDPYRIFYAFDPRRKAILLIGGCKKGDDYWYEKIIPVADNLYDEHLEEIRKLS